MPSAPRILAVVLALAALGVPAAVTQAADSGPLPDGTVEAVDAVYTTSVAVERRGASKGRLAELDRACRKLNTGKGLEGGLRGLCQASAASARASASFGRCKTAPACLRGIDKLRAAIATLVSASRTANTAVQRAVDDRDCRAALRTPASDLEGAQRVRTALRELGSALRSGSDADLRRANRRLQRAQTDVDSASTKRKRFRRACA